MGEQEEETKAREGSGGTTREGGAGQNTEGQGQTGHTVVSATGFQKAEGEGAEYEQAVLRCPCVYVWER